MDYEDDIDRPWWKSVLRGLAMLLGLLALSAVAMGFILLIAKLVDQPGAADQAIFIDMRTPATLKDNAMTRVTPAYGPVAWPDNPGRGAAVGTGRMGGGTPGSATSPAPSSAAPRTPPAPAVGISVDDYRAAVDSGKKVYLPNPQGECDLSGGNPARTADALDKCFAQRAAR